MASTTPTPALPEDSVPEGAIVLINVFTCEPSSQDALMALLDDLTRNVMAGLHGFVSARLHKGLDGRHVANYAVWHSVEDWKAMTRHPDVVEAMRPILALATFQPHTYRAGSLIGPI